MTFEYSTPSRYYNALKAETMVEWPVLDHDFFPYHMAGGRGWTGFFTSRPATKKLIKDYSNLYHALASLFARKAIDQTATAAEVSKILNRLKMGEDWLAVYNHHDGITGTAASYVDMDYKTNLVKAFKPSEDAYRNYMYQSLRDETGIHVRNKGNGLLMCSEKSQNHTVLDCPINDYQNKSQVIVVVHNPMTQSQNTILRILLPSAKYKVQMWSREEKSFKDVQYDVMEQLHFTRNNTM